MPEPTYEVAFGPLTERIYAGEVARPGLWRHKSEVTEQVIVAVASWLLAGIKDDDEAEGAEVDVMIDGKSYTLYIEPAGGGAA